MKPAATSPDGYIIAQSQTDDIPYGAHPSSYNGCGWIAVYNFIKACRELGIGPSGEGTEQPPVLPSPLELSRELAAGSPFNCRLGTAPWRLRRFLQGKGYALRTALGRKKAAAVAGQSIVGILFYLAGHEPHFITCIAQKDGAFRFLNAVDGAVDHQSGFEAFLRDHAKRGPVYLMAL